MNLVAATNGGDGCFGESDVAHLARAHELGHRADGVLDRSISVDPVLVVEIDGVDTQSLERRFAGLPNVLRLAVDTEEGAGLGIPDVAELGGDEHLVPLALDRA